MKLKNIYKKIFFRSEKTDLKYEEAMDIYNRKNGIVIDVRAPEEYQIGHIRGAKNIPIYEMDNVKNTIDKNEVILLYCSTGKRSKMAKEILMKDGYKNVYTFKLKV